MINLALFLGGITTTCGLIWLRYVINQEGFKRNGRISLILFGIFFIFTTLTCLYKPNEINVMTSSDSEITEYMNSLDGDAFNAWFDELSSEEQNRVFHVYMVNKLENAAIEDQFTEE